MNLPGDLEWLILDALVELGINADPAKIAHKLKLLNLDAQGPNGAQPQSSALSKPLESQRHRCSQFRLGRRASSFKGLAQKLAQMAKCQAPNLPNFAYGLFSASDFIGDRSDSRLKSPEAASRLPAQYRTFGHASENTCG